MSSSAYIVQMLGTCLSVMYLLLGMSSVLVFILINTGIITGTRDLLNIQQTYAILAVVLVINFCGFISNILLVISVTNNHTRLMLPCLFFHLIFIIILIVGGTGLFFHLIINLHQYIRASLCVIPILTGLLLVIVWLKIYQKYFLIKSIKRLQKLELMQQFYNYQTYFSFNKQVDRKILTESEYESFHEIPVVAQNRVMSVAADNEVVEVVAEPEPHIYVNEAIDKDPDNLNTFSRIVRVDTLHTPTYRPNYFFGDSFGVLPCRSCNRSLETIEASITFGEEKEETVEEVEADNIHSIIAYEHVVATPKEDEQEILDEHRPDEDLYSPDVKSTLTKDQIMQIFCKLE